MDRYSWKLLVGVLVGFSLLGGWGIVLLRTHQAPLTMESQKGIDEISSVQAATQTPQPPTTEEAPLSQEEFRLLGAEVMKSLPQSSVDSELMILLAAEKFDPIQKAIRREPTLVSEGILLYEECGKSEQLKFSVRALCVAYVEKHTRSLGKRPMLEKFPKKLVDLAKTLNE